MKNVLKMEIWYDTNSKHLFINDRLIGRYNENQALREIVEYFAINVTKIKVEDILKELGVKL